MKSKESRGPLYKKGGIYIKPSKRGSLRKVLKTPKGKNIPAEDLEVKKTDSPAIKKKKVFAKNARGWAKKKCGGIILYHP